MLVGNPLRRSQTVTARQVTVVGGSGSIGRLLLPLWTFEGTRVVVIDRVVPTPPFAATVIVGDVTAPTDDVSEAIRSADTVVLALPESVALQAVPIVAEFASSTVLLVETLSVKSRIHERLLRDAPQLQSVGINPMFAPALGFAGRPVGAVVHHDGPAAKQFLHTLTSCGGRAVELTADEHDRRCAATQALTHAAVLTFGLALANLDVTGEQLTAIATPPHNSMLALLARVAGGLPEVYLDIQSGNPYALAARKALGSAVAELSDVVDHGNEREFGEMMRRAMSPIEEQGDAFRATCARMIAALP
jgi:4-amino-4-deoxyprephenate dehydrogenase